MHETRFEDVLMLAQAAGRSVDIGMWLQNRDPAVTRWAQEFVQVPASVEDVLKVARGQGNPLKDHRHQMNNIVVRDAFTAWPVTFLFHRMRQEQGGIPDHQEFWDWLESPAVCKDWAQAMIERAVSRGIASQDAHRAVYARAIKAWMSCIREMHVVSLLQSWGLPAFHHPIADIILCADVWIGHHIFAIHVTGPVFDRKRKPEDVFPRNEFDIYHLDVTGTKHECVWLVDARDLREIVGTWIHSEAREQLWKPANLTGYPSYSSSLAS